jgi:hypothetical protein
MVGAFGAQYRFDHSQAALQRTREQLQAELNSGALTIVRLVQVRDLYMNVARGGPKGSRSYLVNSGQLGNGPRRPSLGVLLARAADALQTQGAALAKGPTRDDFERTLRLARRAIEHQPTPGEIVLLHVGIARLLTESQRRLLLVQSQLQSLPSQVTRPPAGKTLRTERPRPPAPAAAATSSHSGPS